MVKIMINGKSSSIEELNTISAAGRAISSLRVSGDGDSSEFSLPDVLILNRLEIINQRKISFPQKMYLPGSCYISGCYISAAMPTQLCIGGDLTISGSPGVTRLPENLFVGGSFFFPGPCHPEPLLFLLEDYRGDRVYAAKLMDGWKIITKWETLGVIAALQKWVMGSDRITKEYYHMVKKFSEWVVRAEGRLA